MPSLRRCALLRSTRASALRGQPHAAKPKWRKPTGTIELWPTGLVGLTAVRRLLPELVCSPLHHSEIGRTALLPSVGTARGAATGKCRYPFRNPFTRWLWLITRTSVPRASGRLGGRATEQPGSADRGKEPLSPDRRGKDARAGARRWAPQERAARLGSFRGGSWTRAAVPGFPLYAITGFAGVHPVAPLGGRR